MERLYETLAEILEIENVEPNAPLKDFENWDSLTVLSIVASVDANYGVSLTNEDLKRITTASDLATIVRSRMSR